MRMLRFRRGILCLCESRNMRQDATWNHMPQRLQLSIPILQADNIHSMSLHHRQGGLAVSVVNLMQKILSPIVNEILGSNDG